MRVAGRGRVHFLWGLMQCLLFARNARTRFGTWKLGRCLRSPQISKHLFDIDASLSAGLLGFYDSLRPPLQGGVPASLLKLPNRVTRRG